MNVMKKPNTPYHKYDTLNNQIYSVSSFRCSNMSDTGSVVDEDDANDE